MQQPEQQVDIDALVNTLDKIGVRSPDHLEGLYHSAQAQGRTGQELGLARQEMARMQEEINRLKSISQTA